MTRDEARAFLEKAMPDIAAAMPWYDEAHPDYSEAIEAILDAYAPALDQPQQGESHEATEPHRP